MYGRFSGTVVAQLASYLRKKSNILYHVDNAL